MSELVPVLDVIRELRSADVEVDYRSFLENPASYWAQLPLEGQQRILTRIQAKGPVDAVRHLAVVKRRRAPAPSLETHYVHLDWRETGQGQLTLSQRFTYEPVDPKGIDGELVLPEDDITFALADTILREATWARGRRRVIDLLDEAWEDGQYDVGTHGALAVYNAADHFKELERYWIEAPFAFAVILRNPAGETVYHLQEPRLSDTEQTLLLALNDKLRDVVILEDEDVGDRASFLARKTFSLLRRFGGTIARQSAYKIAYFIIRNYLGFGRLDVIMRDVHIEDISCNGPNLPIYLAHDRYRNVPSSLQFGEIELNTFTVKLAQLGGKLLSVAQPLVDATLPDGSRIQACLGREVTNHGSAFTIRKFREDPLTCVDLIKSGAHSIDTMALLWLAVEMKRSLIVMGATASGKTTTLNCLSQFIPPTHKIVTIEDTREITLQHENWLASITREAFTGGGAERISMYDLLRAALRQRPEYLIVGEIRGEEGLTLFQAMSTGHTCFSTMHAGSVENAVHRLENPPISVPRVMITSLDFFLLQGHVDLNGKPARRMISLTELNGMDPTSKNVRMNDVFRWDNASDTHMAASKSHVLDDARKHYGWTRERLDAEYEARRRVLAGLVERNERHYTDVARAVWQFYRERENEGTPPETTFSPVESGGSDE